MSEPSGGELADGVQDIGHLIHADRVFLEELLDLIEHQHILVGMVAIMVAIIGHGGDRGTPFTSECAQPCAVRPEQLKGDGQLVM